MKNKQSYTSYLDLLDKFLECQEPITVKKQYFEPGYDIFDFPSELFEAEGDEENGEAEDSSAQDDAGNDTEDAENTADSEDQSESGEADQPDGGEDQSQANDDTVDLDADFSDIDSMSVEDVDMNAGDVNGGAAEPTSVSAKQLLSELTSGQDNIYTRVANAVKDSGKSEVTVKDILPIISLAIKKFMKNKNYASLSKQAMKGLVMNIAKTMANPPKKGQQDSGEGNTAAEA